jgi:hypothetical protein
MRIIYKYPINIKLGQQVIKMPKFANLLSFQMQGGNLYLWAEVNTDYKEDDIYIEIIPTGVEIKCKGIHKGTVVDENTLEVWHLYQIFDK